MKETDHLRNRVLTSIGLVLRFCLISTCFSPVSVARAEINALPEYAVKAAFVYKFALYVEWPEDAFEAEESHVLIGVLGPKWMLEQVEAAVRGRTLAGRPVTVAPVVADDLSRFHILFVVQTEAGRLNRQSVSQDRPVLVVTETPEWQDLGSVINFVLTDDRIRFDVDLASAEKRGLTLSSRLLNVARNIQDKP